MLRRSQNKDIHSEASAMVPHEHPVAAMVRCNSKGKLVSGPSSKFIARNDLQCVLATSCV